MSVLGVIRNDHQEWLDEFSKLSGLPVSNTELPFKECADANLANYRNLIDANRKKYRDLQASLLRIDDSITPKEFTLTNGQKNALEKLFAWLKSPEPYFVLRGYAGTGKTHLVSLFAQNLANYAALFTAPTNKATKVLRTLLPNHQCKTIYSALSLKMVAREDELVLSPADTKFNLRGFLLICVDESSMLNSELMDYIDDVSKNYGIKFLFIADFAQLPPVGEDMSPVSGLSCSSAELTEVVRHDNQILTLATHVRKAIMTNKRLRPIDLSDFEGSRSVWRLSPRAFDLRVQKAASKGFEGCRVIAWRNKTVDYLNDLVRSELYGINPPSWMPGDCIVITEPIVEKQQTLATVDDEGVITSVDEGTDLETNLQCYFINVRMETGLTLKLRIIHEDSVDDLSGMLGDLASAARKPGNGKLWQKFWGLKNRFNHIRHSYSITAHRSQGSSIHTVFVDAGDILSNPDRSTAYRCLYVAISRASHRLYITGLPT